MFYIAKWEKRFLALESIILRFRQNKKKSSPNLQNFEQLLQKTFFYLMTFFTSAFILHSKKRFLVLESSFLRFRQNKENSSPNLQNFEQLLLKTFFDLMTFFNT